MNRRRRAAEEHGWRPACVHGSSRRFPRERRTSLGYVTYRNFVGSRVLPGSYSLPGRLTPQMSHDPKMSDYGEDLRQKRDRGVVRVLYIVLWLNVAVAAVKIVLGSRTGALSLFADGLHATLDASSNVVARVGGDRRRAEARRRASLWSPSLRNAGLSIGLLILSGMGVVLGLWQGITGTGRRPTCGCVGGHRRDVHRRQFCDHHRYEARRAKDLASNLLEADAGHTASDTLGAAAVLGSFVFVHFGWGWADLVAAVVVFCAHWPYRVEGAQRQHRHPRR